MRTFLTVIAAGALSVVAGIAVVLFATYVIGRHDDAMTMGLGRAFGIAGTLLYAVLAMLVNGTVMWRGRTERAIRIAMLVLAAPPVLLLLYGMAQGGGSLMREMQGVLQFIIPPLLVAVVQWLVLRTTLRRASTAS